MLQFDVEQKHRYTEYWYMSLILFSQSRPDKFDAHNSVLILGQALRTVSK